MMSPRAALQHALWESPGVNHTGSTGTAWHFAKSSTLKHPLLQNDVIRSQKDLKNTALGFSLQQKQAWPHPCPPSWGLGIRCPACISWSHCPVDTQASGKGTRFGHISSPSTMHFLQPSHSRKAVVPGPGWQGKQGTGETGKSWQCLPQASHATAAAGTGSLSQ